MMGKNGKIKFNAEDTSKIQSVICLQAVTLVIELQLKGIQEVRERHQAVDGVIHQNNSIKQNIQKKKLVLSHSKVCEIKPVIFSVSFDVGETSVSFG